MCCNLSELNIDNIARCMVGSDVEVELLNGKKQKYIFFDTGASAPAFNYVRDKVNSSLEYYSAVHRGAGVKSIVSTAAYDEAREVVADFVGADLENKTLIFTKNTTEAINKLSYRLNLKKTDVVITTLMEHHSNDLPWRRFCKCLHSEVRDDGSLILEDLEKKLKKYHGKVKLVAVTGASNVTGIVNPIHKIAELVHKYDSKILVDCAQLAPHRAIDMKPVDSPEHLDFIALSAHKMYAPYGGGALIAPKELLNNDAPEYVGGGTVKVVLLDEVFWADDPDKDEAGSPNYLGAIALASACKVLKQIGMDKVAEHEREITEYAMKRIKEVDGLMLLGPQNFEEMDKLGVLSFKMKDTLDALVGAVLCYEGGMGVRYGCFCAHPYLKRLLKIEDEEMRKTAKLIIDGDRSVLPGAVRISFGIFNNKEEIDRLIEVLKTIPSKTYKGDYVLDKTHGAFHPRNFAVDTKKYFTFD